MTKGALMVSSPFPREKAAGRETAALRRTDVVNMPDGQLTAVVTSSLARCSGDSGNPDDWFPVATRPARARTEAARALALCAQCPVRAQCLELSMRLWQSSGRHGVWGGLLAADRAEVYREWKRGVPVATLLEGELRSA
jgi:hypothetical protein